MGFGFLDFTKRLVFGFWKLQKYWFLGFWTFPSPKNQKSHIFGNAYIDISKSGGGGGGAGGGGDETLLSSDGRQRADGRDPIPHTVCYLPLDGGGPADFKP